MIRFTMSAACQIELAVSKNMAYLLPDEVDSLCDLVSSVLDLVAFDALV